MALHTVGLPHEGGRQLAQNDRKDAAINILSITMSNLRTVAWHGFLEKIPVLVTIRIDIF